MDYKEAFIPTKLKSLDKATVIELFFDLIFIFCLRTIIPVVSEEQQPSVYLYLMFTFTFLLTMQIWFHATLIMNKFGTGKIVDIVTLVTVMFLLIYMTHQTSSDWAYYYIYNGSWALILLAFIINLAIKYRMFQNLDETDKKTMRRMMGVLALQIVLIGISTPIPGLPGQIMCLITVILGYLAWFIKPIYKLKPANFPHLVERCLLIIIIVFGETIIGLAEIMKEKSEPIYSTGIFCLTIVLFLIIYNQMENAIDENKETSGMGMLATTGVLTFIITNITVAFELMAKDETFLLAPIAYFATGVALLLLATFLFIPYCRPIAIRKSWVFLRILAALVIVQLPYLMGAHPRAMVYALLFCTTAVLIYDWVLLKQAGIDQT